MFDLSDVHPLSECKRRQRALLEHFKTTRRPLLVTLNGRAEVVIQDAGSYPKLIEQMGKASEEAVGQPRSRRVDRGKASKHDEAPAT